MEKAQENVDEIHKRMLDENREFFYSFLLNLEEQNTQSNPNGEKGKEIYNKNRELTSQRSNSPDLTEKPEMFFKELAEILKSRGRGSNQDSFNNASESNGFVKRTLDKLKSFFKWLFQLTS